MKKRNAFIWAALEELQAEEAGVTEVNIDSSKDAVAELMEKNVTLEDANSELTEEAFDNDVDAVSNVSDSVSEDLEEVVHAGAALEQLAEICRFTARSGQANTASVAGLVFALEQITDRVGLASAVPALEEAVANYTEPKEQQAAAQVEEVGKGALEKAKELGKRLIDGIKRIIGWIMGVIRTALARSAKISKRAKAAFELVGDIDESKSIDAGPFIASLRLVEGGGDANKQFDVYAKLASQALYGFFSDTFIKNMKATFADSVAEGYTDLGEKEVGTRESRANDKLVKILKVAMSAIYTEHGDASDVSVEIPAAVKDKDLTVGLTEPCVGGLQLYMAATLDGSDTWFCRAGVAKKELKTAQPASIPVVKKEMARDFLNVIVKWMEDQKKLESNLKQMDEWSDKDGTMAIMKDLNVYVSSIAALFTGCVPHLIRLNLQNSAAFIAYVEKSVAVSKK